MLMILNDISPYKPQLQTSSLTADSPSVVMLSLHPGALIFNYYLLTESEIFTGKSQTEILPSLLGLNIRRDRLTSSKGTPHQWYQNYIICTSPY